jgi:hypothetical protein
MAHVSEALDASAVGELARVIVGMSLAGALIVIVTAPANAQQFVGSGQKLLDCDTCNVVNAAVGGADDDAWIAVEHEPVPGSADPGLLVLVVDGFLGVITGVKQLQVPGLLTDSGIYPSVAVPTVTNVFVIGKEDAGAGGDGHLTAWVKTPGMPFVVEDVHSADLSSQEQSRQNIVHDPFTNEQYMCWTTKPGLVNDDVNGKAREQVDFDSSAIHAVSETNDTEEHCDQAMFPGGPFRFVTFHRLTADDIWMRITDWNAGSGMWTDQASFFLNQSNTLDAPTIAIRPDGGATADILVVADGGDEIFGWECVDDALDCDTSVAFGNRFSIYAAGTNIMDPKVFHVDRGGGIWDAFVVFQRDGGAGDQTVELISRCNNAAWKWEGVLNMPAAYKPTFPAVTPIDMHLGSAPFATEHQVHSFETRIYIPFVASEIQTPDASGVHDLLLYSSLSTLFCH